MQALFAFLIFLELHVDVLHVSVSVLFASFFFSRIETTNIKSTYFAAKNATYAVQKESLKKIQAKFATITAFISYLYISFSQLVQQDSIQLTVGS